MQVLLAQRLQQIFHCNENARGCLLELRNGARLLMTVKDLLKALTELNLHPIAATTPTRFNTPPKQESLDFSGTSQAVGSRQAVLAAVQQGALSSDEIGLATGLSAGRVSELILTLRLEGVLVTDPSGRLQIRNQLI